MFPISKVTKDELSTDSEGDFESNGDLAHLERPELARSSRHIV